MKTTLRETSRIAALLAIFLLAWPGLAAEGTNETDLSDIDLSDIELPEEEEPGLSVLDAVGVARAVKGETNAVRDIFASKVGTEAVDRLIKAPLASETLLGKLAQGLDLELKAFDSKDGATSLGLGYSYSKTIVEPALFGSSNPTEYSGVRLELNASGNIAFDRETNPEDFLDSKVGFEFFRSHGGAVETTDEAAARLQQLESVLTTYETKPDLFGSAEWVEFRDLMGDHLTDQYYFDVSANAGLESDQTFEQRQYTYGLGGALIVKGWGRDSLWGKVNILDYVPAAIRVATGMDRHWSPRGSAFPEFYAGIDQVMPEDTTARTMAGDDADFARWRVEASFKTMLGRWKEDTIFLEANFRHYQEIEPAASVRSANQDEHTYFTAALLLPKNLYISYSAGKLPLTEKDDRIYEAGLKFNF